MQSPTENTQQLWRNNIARGLLLFASLLAIYTLSYIGIPYSADEYTMFDSIESFSKRGNFLRTFEYHVEPVFQDENTPGQVGKYEPAQIILGSILYRIAQQISGAGLIHSVWLLNIFITTSTALAVYTLALWRGYSSTVAVLAAYIFGLATIAWHYSQTLFREPLLGLSLLFAFIFATQLRQALQNNKRWHWLLLGLVMAVIVGILTKMASLLALPAIVLVALPFSFRQLLNLRTVLVVGGVLLILAALLIVLGETFDFSDDRYAFRQIYETAVEYTKYENVVESSLAYHFSPTRSFWLFSPALLLSIGGMWRMVQRGEWQLPLGFIATFLLFAASYGVRHGMNWWGGWNWGPRYLLPLVPIAVFLSLPFLDYLLNQSRQYWTKIILALLLLLSVIIQLSGILVPYTNFYTELALQNPEKIVPYQVYANYNWKLSDSLLVYGFEHFNTDVLIWNFAEGGVIIPVIVLVLLLFQAFLFRQVWLSQAQNYRPLYIAVASSLIASMVLLLLTVYAIREDERVYRFGTDMRSMILDLNEIAHQDDVVLLGDGELMIAFMDGFSAPPPVYTLPQPLNFSTITENPPPAEAPTQALLQWAVPNSRGIWYVTSRSSFLPIEQRPIERFLGSEYFWVQEINSGSIRAIYYFTKPSPEGYSTILSTMFGDALQLQGLALDADTPLKAGDILPLSLFWEVQAPLNADYHTNIMLVASNGTVLVEHTGPPQGKTGNMLDWEPGTLYTDHYGILLPEALEPAGYELRLAVYHWQDGSLVLPINALPEDLPWVVLGTIQVRAGED